MSKLKEVKMWFARNQDDKVVNIHEVDSNDTYTCVLCGSKVIPKAIDSMQIQPHFAHMDISKCSSEHMIHWWFKHKLLEVGDEFSVKTNIINTYVVKCIDVEKSYYVNNVIYTPDLTITTEDDEIIHFELANTNKKKVDEYIGIWSELNHIIVEVDIWKIANSRHIEFFNALYYKGKTFCNTKRKSSYQKSIGDYIDTIEPKDNYDVEYKQRIKNLNWFWTDLCKYKQKTIDIEDLMLSMNEVKGLDSDIVEDLLTKPSCINILNDIGSYKKNIMSNFIKEITNDDKFLIEYNEDSEYLIIKYNEKIENIYFNSQYKYNYIRRSIFYSDEELKNEILDFKNQIYSEIKKIDNHCKLTKKIKEIYNISDENYRFTWSNGVDINKEEYYALTINYNKNQLFNIRIPFSMFNDWDEHEIISIIKNIICGYFDNIRECVNKSLLFSIVNDLDNIYKNIYITTKENRYRLRLKIEQIEEDEFIIKLLGEDDIHFKYKWDLNYKIDSIIYSKNKAEGVIYNNDNLYKFKFQISNKLNKTILKKHKDKDILKIWGKLPFRN